MKKLKITHVNTLAGVGGAAKSTMRLVAAQRAMGHDAVVLVGTSYGSCDYVSVFDKQAQSQLSDQCSQNGLLYYEYQGSHKLVDNEIIRSSDIVHCSNLHGDYFNPWSLSALSHIKPVVWTLRDMQSITGHCAHSFDCVKWQSGCGNCQRLDIYPELETDSTAQLIADKRYIYENSFLQIVTPADWLRKKLPNSILKNHPAELIYNCCDTDTFKPYPKAQIRQKLGIAQDAFVVGAVAHGGVLANQWKGGKYTQIIWDCLKDKIPGGVFLNIGSSVKSADPSILNIGPVKDEKILAQIYNAFDVFLYTSIADTCPLVVIEALACGVPIVTFDTGGVGELVRNKIDGFVFPQFETENLASAVKAIYDNRKIGEMFSTNARAGAIERFTIKNTADQYIQLYHNWIDRHKNLSKNKKYFDMSRVPEIIKTDGFLNAEKSKAKPVAAANNVKAVANNFKPNPNLKYPKITVVTPSFNQADYLEQCICSVLEQGYPNLEYIVIDGGSTDGSVDIIRKYRSRLNYWISEPDKGQYHAIMKGFAKSTGEIMGWINSDDMLHEGGLFRLAELFEFNRDVEFLTGRRIGFEADDSLHYYAPDLIAWNRKRLLDKKNIYKRNWFVMQEGTYWRRSLWQRAGSTVDLSLSLAADFELWARFSRYAKLYTTNALIGGFRGYDGGQKSQQQRTQYLAQCDAVIERELKIATPFCDTARPKMINYPIKGKPDSADYDVSIVLCTMNRAELLDNMLASLPRAANGLNYQIVAVVGDCSDNTLEILKKHNVTKIYNEAEHLGSGKHSWPQLYNFAFSNARGKWAMFASDDIIFEQNCLSNAFDELENQPDNVAGGLFFYKNLWEKPRREPFDREKYFVGMGREFNVLMNYGLVRLDYFKQTGGFDEEYNFYYADSDFCNRLYAQGKILIPLGNSLITHDDKLDQLKQVNAQRVQRDLLLYATRWQGSYIDEDSRPHRLVWQKELADDYSLPVKETDDFDAIQFYWRGLAFYQRADFARSCQCFALAIQADCNHWKVYFYLALSAVKCGQKALAVKAANKAISLSNNDSRAKKLLSKIFTAQTSVQKTIGGLIFSKDRAMQLKATLESFFACCDDSDKVALHVLYKATRPLYKRQYQKLQKEFNNVVFIAESDFKNDVQQVISKFEYILFLVDDNIFVKDFKIGLAVDSLGADSDSLGFSLRLGKNTNYCYAKSCSQALPEFESIGKGVLKFDWTRAELDFGYPLEVSSSIYKSAGLINLIAQLKFDNPNMFEGLMALNAQIFAAAKRNLLCFENSVTFCNPANVVQSVAANRSSDRADYDAFSLANMFDNGRRIDVSRYKGFVVNSCHQEAELFFIKSDNKIVKAAPKVSIQMAAYNADKYIEPAIKSVLEQSFTDFELIIVDDGSTDSTEAIIKSFDDSRIKYIKRPHQGCAAARNAAISLAAGKYILCVDSDDCIAADYISSMMNYIEANPGFDYYYPQRLILIDANGKQMDNSWDYQDFSDNRILPAFLFANGFLPIPNPAAVVRAEVFSRCGLYEDNQTVEDFVFLCKNALKIKFKRVQIGSDYFYRYLQQSASKDFKPRDRIIADTLNRMVQIYPPDVICLALTDITDPIEAKKHYYKYVSDVFYKHANGHHLVKFGDYYRKFGDCYRDRLLKLTQNYSLTTPCRSEV